MSEKTIDIIEIVTDTNIYTINSIPVGMTFPVEKIVFFSSLDSYNKNRQFEGACYVVFFKEVEQRRIVPIKEVKDVGIKIEDKNKKPYIEAMEFPAVKTKEDKE